MKQFINIYILLLTSILSVSAYDFTFTEEEIRGADNLDALVEIYRKKTGDIVSSKEEIINISLKDWYSISSIQYINALEKALNNIKPFGINDKSEKKYQAVVKTGDTNFHLFGFWHGSESIKLSSNEGSMPNYRKSIMKYYAEHKIINKYPILTEQNIHYLLNLESIDTPDHIIKQTKGISYKPIINGFLWDLEKFLHDLFHNDYQDLQVEYHYHRKKDIVFQNPVTFLELGEKYNYPKQLMLEYVLYQNYDTNLLPHTIQFHIICTKRSLYMAGFLEGYAKSRNLENIVYMMGASHFKEVKSFLTNMNHQAKQTKEYILGFEHGQMSEDDIKEIFDSIDAYNKEYNQYIEPIDKYRREIKSGALPFMEYLLCIVAKSKAYYYLTSTQPTYKMYGLFLLLNHLQFNILEDNSFSSILGHIDYFGLWIFISGRFIDPYKTFPLLSVLYHLRQ